MYLIANQKIEVIKADPVSIGGKRPKKFQETGHSYTLHERHLTKGMAFYLFSDGYIDQQGPEGRKLGSPQFRETLLQNNHQSADEQKNTLEEKMNQWQGNKNQMDDMLIVGVRV